MHVAGAAEHNWPAGGDPARTHAPSSQVEAEDQPAGAEVKTHTKTAAYLQALQARLACFWSPQGNVFCSKVRAYNVELCAYIFKLLLFEKPAPHRTRIGCGNASKRRSGFGLLGSSRGVGRHLWQLLGEASATAGLPACPIIAASMSRDVYAALAFPAADLLAGIRARAAQAACKARRRSSLVRTLLQLLRDVQHFVKAVMLEQGEQHCDTILLATKLSAVGYIVTVRAALGGGASCFRCACNTRRIGRLV